MSKWVVLLRGINVGGNQIVKMATLKEALTRAGFENVVTILQSGNIIFTQSGFAEAQVADAFLKVMKDTFGFTPATIVVSADQWDHVIVNNPFKKEAEDTGNWVQVYFGSEESNRKAIEDYGKAYEGIERIRVVGDQVYTHFPEGIGTSLLFKDRQWGKLTQSLTARNWNTVLRIQAEITKG